MKQVDTKIEIYFLAEIDVNWNFLSPLKSCIKK
jgi:hypothetical protein